MYAAHFTLQSGTLPHGNCKRPPQPARHRHLGNVNTFTNAKLQANPVEELFVTSIVAVHYPGNISTRPQRVNLLKELILTWFHRCGCFSTHFLSPFFPTLLLLHQHCNVVNLVDSWLIPCNVSSSVCKIECQMKIFKNQAI